MCYSFEKIIFPVLEEKREKKGVKRKKQLMTSRDEIFIKIGMLRALAKKQATLTRVTRDSTPQNATISRQLSPHSLMGNFSWETQNWKIPEKIQKWTIHNGVILKMIDIFKWHWRVPINWQNSSQWLPLLFDSFFHPSKKFFMVEFGFVWRGDMLTKCVNQLQVLAAKQ